MILKCLGTGSHGNCYLLKSKNDILILDCGLKLNEIITDKFIGSLSNIKCCLITHSHKDHNKSEKEIALCGIPMLTYNNLIINKKNIYGNFEIMPFKLFHDCICYGFLIRDRETKEILCYATDTYKLPLISNVDYWLVECNYCEDILDNSLSYENANYSYIERLRRTHMGDKFLYEYFGNLRDKPKKVLLCHQSNSNNYDSNIAMKYLKEVLCDVEDIKPNNEYVLKGSD